MDSKNESNNNYRKWFYAAIILFVLRRFMFTGETKVGILLTVGWIVTLIVGIVKYSNYKKNSRKKR